MIFLLSMNVLKEFVFFIRENKKEDVVDRIVEIGGSVERENNLFSLIPLNNNPGAFLHDRLDTALSMLESDDIQQLFNEQITRQRKSEIPKSEIESSADKLFFFAHLFKIALIEFIPEYTNDVKIATKIILGLETEYQHFQTLVLKQFEKHGANLKARLKETEDWYKDLFDNAHDLIHFVDADGTIMHVNNAWQKTLHYSIGEIEGRSIYDFIEETGREEFINYRKKILNTPADTDQIKVRLKTKTGKTVFAEGFISPKIIAGKGVYTIGIFRDVTARIENEENLNLINVKLREREENLQQLVTYAPDAIIAINAQSLITYWNPKAEEIFGWNSNEVLNKSLAEIIIPVAYREDHRKGMERYLATGEARVLNKTIEVTAMHKNGNEFYISLTISSTRQSGNFGFIAFIRDITQQKKNALELEKRKKQLEESNRELEQYSWLTSHDLMEPLRKILTYSDIILTQHNGELAPGVQKNVV